MRSALAEPAPLLVEVPITSEVIDAMSRVPRKDVPDLPDRLIAGTALLLGVPLVTRDRKIRNSAVHTIW